MNARLTKTTLTTLAVSCGLMLAGPAGALAGGGEPGDFVTLDTEKRVLNAATTVGVANNMKITVASGVVTVHDTSIKVFTTADGCEAIDPNTVQCAVPTLTRSVVELEDGNDTVDTSKGGVGDQVLCGEGIDTVVADTSDLLTECEKVTRVGGPPAPPVRPTPPAAPAADTRAPACSFVKAAKKAKRSTFLKGYAATLRCDEKVTLTGRLQIGGVILGEKSAAPAASKFTLKPAKAARKLLGRRFTARVVIQARDAAGNTRTLTRRVKVTTPKRKARR